MKRLSLHKAAEMEGQSTSPLHGAARALDRVLSETDMLYLIHYQKIFLLAVTVCTFITYRTVK